MVVFDIQDSAHQRWQSVLSGTPCQITLRWLPRIAHWTLSIDIRGERKVTGRLIVKGRDLLQPYNLGIGIIFAAGSADLTRQSLISGDVRLYHASRAEWNDLLSA